jgi:hypothetical protein
VRYETKFRVTGLPLAQIRLLVRNNPGFFREIFHEREVHNIYLDSPDMAFYLQGVNGEANRQKVRIRWYEDKDGIALSPTLERKLKHGLIGTKEQYPLPDFPVNEPLAPERWLSLLQGAVPPLLISQLAGLRSVLHNRFRRQYFLSADGGFRLTLDQQLSFRAARGISPLGGVIVKDTASAIIEMKYDSNQPGAEKISNAFPFRVSKNSKYLTGVQLLYNW